VKPLRPRGHILTTMNLRPAGGTLRPGGHITRTMNLRRGCRPVTSAASRRRVSGPCAPLASSASPVGPPPDNRSAPCGSRLDSASRCSRPGHNRPVGSPEGDLTGPGRLPLGARWDRRYRCADRSIKEVGMIELRWRNAGLAGSLLKARGPHQNLPRRQRDEPQRGRHQRSPSFGSNRRNPPPPPARAARVRRAPS